MTNRIFISVLAFASAGLLAADAGAASRANTSNGCDALRRVVESQLAAWSLAKDGQRIVRNASRQAPKPDSPQYCASTAAATSAGFSTAMLAAGIPVLWGRDRIQPGDHCYSHDLSQCYPSVGSGSLPSALQLGFVNDAWKAVSRSVVDVMSYGAASDMAVFETGVLESAIARRLHRETEGLRRQSDLPATSDDFR